MVDTTKDWAFDIGWTQSGNLVVDAHASTLPAVICVLNRNQLIQLRESISFTLKRYPEPPEKFTDEEKKEKDNHARL